MAERQKAPLLDWHLKETESVLGDVGSVFAEPSQWFQWFNFSSTSGGGCAGVCVLLSSGVFLVGWWESFGSLHFVSLFGEGSCF